MTDMRVLLSEENDRLIDENAALRAEVERLRAALEKINVGEGWAAQAARAALTAQEKTDDMD